jgi:hypothetical protein
MSSEAEIQFLLLAGRLFLKTAQGDEATTYLQSPFDWDRLLHLAQREGIAGLTAAELQRLTRENDLDLPIAAFSEALRHTFARNGNHRAELMRLRDTLRKNQIQLILLKGAALVETHYGGQLGLRPLSDVDVLAKPQDLPLIRQALESMGFRRPNPLSTFFTNGSAAFDLHTDLIGASRIHRRALAIRFDMDTVWENALPLDERDDRLLVLSPPFQFLHLAVHGLKHSFSRLIWLIDLALVAREQDWEELLALAGETGASRPLTYALSALERCLSFEIPRGVREALPRLNRIEGLFLGLVEDRRSKMQVLGEPILAFSIPSWSGRLAYLIEYLFPKRRTLSHDSSSTPSWLLYPKRLGQIARRGLGSGVKS